MIYPYSCGRSRTRCIDVGLSNIDINMVQVPLMAAEVFVSIYQRPQEAGLRLPPRYDNKISQSEVECE